MQSLLSERAVRAGSGALGDPRRSAGKISFFAGFPDPSSLPKGDIIEATRVALEADGEWALQYGATQGYSGLIDELLKKLARDQGIEAAPENVLITNGASQALALIVEMLVDPGDVILSEEPTWMGAVQNFTAAGADVHTIPVDDAGTDIAALERELRELRSEGRQAKLLYLIPNFQNPTGVTTSLERRQRIMVLAREHNLPIIEDDAYFDLRYAGERLPALHSMDNAGLVMYMGTFSKIMAAGMRLGWVIADESVIRQMAALKHEGGTSPFAGQVAAQFCASGTLVEHVRELTELYHARRDAMLRALEERMPEGTTWTTPEGGFFVWVTFPMEIDVARMLTSAAEQGVEFLPGSACFFREGGDNMIRLSYSFADEQQIAQGIEVIGNLARQHIATSGSDA